MWDFLEFRRMLTPTLVQFVFFVGLAVMLAAAVYLFIDGRIGAGVVLLLIGPLVLRIYLELIVVTFRIHSELVAIADRVEELWVDSERQP